VPLEDVQRLVGHAEPRTTGLPQTLSAGLRSAPPAITVVFSTAPSDAEHLNTDLVLQEFEQLAEKKIKKENHISVELAVQ